MAPPPLMPLRVHASPDAARPLAGPCSAPGDGEGMNEMNASMTYLRQFLGGFRWVADAVREAGII